MMAVPAFKDRDTDLVMARLVSSFCFDGGVDDAVFTELFPHRFFGAVGLAVGANVQGGAVMNAVHTPYMDVMGIDYAVQLTKMLF